MDINEVEGTVRNVVGKVQDAAGALTGDTANQLKGKATQAAGVAQAKAGEALDNVRELAADRPVGTLMITAGIAFLLGMLFARRD